MGDGRGCLRDRKADEAGDEMSGKKPEGIPLAALIAGKGFKRNYDIEFKEALDETLHRDAIDGAKHKAAQRAKAQKPRGAALKTGAPCVK